MKSTDIYSLFEAQQQLFEVEMSPSNLKKLASAIPGVKVGMEFEMVVPNARSGDDDDEGELEPDYDQDESADDIDDIVRFFASEDDYVGQNNDRRELRRLEEELRDMFSEYQAKEIADEWSGSDGKQFFANWIKENVDSDEVAEFAETPDDLFGNKEPTKEDYAKFIEDQWESEGSYYDEARDAFHEERIDEGDFSERDFLRDIGISDMSDVANRVSTGITWPFYTSIGDGGGEGESVEDIGEEFSDAIGKTVYTSTSYHGAKRSAYAYSLEPDSSIKTIKSNEAGLEFISPPMEVDEMFDDLKAVKKWADQRGCYTNSSTGLHINVSIPDYSLEKLDYVKLAILLGDKYVLDQFGRLSNGYAKSALDVIKARAENKEDANRLLKQLKNNVETIASKILHSGRTDKFTSINTKDGYVEFRSAGGDWLDKNFDKIENTIMRNIVALDAACDPNKYKKEYVKSLYKLLKPKDPKSEMGMFARYMTGDLTRTEYVNTLAKTREERFVGQGIKILGPGQVDENDWEVTYDDGTKSDTIYIANTNQVSTEQEAFDAAKKLKPQWFRPDTIEYITVKPFKFGEELEGLKLYRADYGSKSTGVVAKNEEQAIQNVKLMDPDTFTMYPNSRIVLHDQDVTSKKEIKKIYVWMQSHIEQGKEWLARKKIWLLRGTSSDPGQPGRFYIAATIPNDAIAIAKRIDPSLVNSSNFEIYAYDHNPDADTYQAYATAQEDMIRQREEDRINRKAAQDETIDVSNLKGYRVSSMNGFTYIVAENGAEAAEIATKLDPEKFPDVTGVTVQDAGSIGATDLIRGMYARQQSRLSQLPQSDTRQTSSTSSSKQTRIGMLGNYNVKNLDTGESTNIAAISGADAIQDVKRRYPSWANASLYAMPLI